MAEGKKYEGDFVCDDEGEKPTTGKPAARKSVNNHWSTRELVTLAVFCAMSMALSFIQIPIFPPAPWLQYDPSGIVILAAALLFGPSAGITVAIVGWIPKLIMSPLGMLVNIVAIVGMVLVVGLVYKKKHDFTGGLIGLIAGAVVFTILAVLMNFVVTPLYTTASIADVAAMVLPILIPFNLIKCTINVVVTALIYNPVSNLIKLRDGRSHV